MGYNAATSKAHESIGDDVRPGWAAATLITFLVAYAIEVIKALLFGLAADAQPELPTTFHTLWEASALVGLFALARRLRVTAEIFFIGVLIGAFIAFIAGLLLPNGTVLLDENYIGVRWIRFDEFDPETRYASPLIVGSLYPRNYPDVQRAIRDAAKGSRVNN